MKEVIMLFEIIKMILAIIGLIAVLYLMLPDSDDYKDWKKSQKED